MSLVERIRSPGPKRILTIDGGGVRSLISVEMLLRMEDILGATLGRGPGFVLADYFDCIAGTESGALIAMELALGKRCEHVRGMLLENARYFDRAAWTDQFRYRYEDDALSETLTSEFGPKTELGSDALRSLLILVVRNDLSGSPWVISNNPFAKYNARDRPDSNLSLPLWRLARASLPRPEFFPPEVVDMAGRSFVIRDGGHTVYSNPSFLAYLIATAAPYRVGWQSGEADMLVVSVGSGYAPRTGTAALDPWDSLRFTNDMLVDSAKVQQDLMCRTLGVCLTGDPIDREVGDLIGSRGSIPALFTYLRYDVDISAEGILSLGERDIDPGHLERTDSVDYLEDIGRVGQIAAATKVRVKDFSSVAAR